MERVDVQARMCLPGIQEYITSFRVALSKLIFFWKKVRAWADAKRSIDEFISINFSYSARFSKNYILTLSRTIEVTRIQSVLRW